MAAGFARSRRRPASRSGPTTEAVSPDPPEARTRAERFGLQAPRPRGRTVGVFFESLLYFQLTGALASIVKEMAPPDTIGADVLFALSLGFPTQPAHDAARRKAPLRRARSRSHRIESHARRA